jgi:hypothetical protein
MKGQMTGLRLAGAALAALAVGAGCWVSMPVLESGAGSAGVVPAVISPESELGLDGADEPDSPLLADPADADAPDDAASARLEVEATLVEARGAPHCGRAKFVVVMRYEVRRVIAGSHAGRELYVAHACPELGLPRCRGGTGEAVRGFRAGDVHRLQLTRGAGDGSLVDKFEARALPRYRARCGERVVAPGK